MNEMEDQGSGFFQQIALEDVGGGDKADAEGEVEGWQGTDSNPMKPRNHVSGCECPLGK